MINGESRRLKGEVVESNISTAQMAGLGQIVNWSFPNRRAFAFSGNNPRYEFCPRFFHTEMYFQSNGRFLNAIKQFIFSPYHFMFPSQLAIVVYPLSSLFTVSARPSRFYCCCRCVLGFKGSLVSKKCPLLFPAAGTDIMINVRS